MERPLPSAPPVEGDPPGDTVVHTERASFLQGQLWLIQQLAPDDSLYNELYAVRYRGPVDAAALEHALTTVVARSEILRTTFRFIDGELVQDVLAPEPVSLASVEDLSLLAAEERERALRACARELAEEPYDPARGALLRTTLVRLAEREYVLLVGMHHIVTDGTSMQLLLHELDACYRERLGGLEPDATPAPVQYAEFARWQRTALEEGLLAEAAAFWADTLRGVPGVLELPTERPRPRRKRTRGRRDEFRLDPGLAPRIADVAAALGCTPFTVLLAAFAAVVYRYTNRDDFVVGTGAPGRPVGFERVLGYFANMVPLRLRPLGTTTFAELVQQCADRFYDALDHQLLPFEKIVELVQPERDPSVTPLVQVVFTMWDAGARRPALGEARGELLEVQRGRSRFDLLIEVVADDERPHAVFVEYDDALFAPDDVAQLVRHYERALAAGVADLGATLAALPMLAAEELAVLTGDGRAVYDRDGNVAPAGAVGELRGPPGARPRLARRCRDGAVVEVGLPERRVRVGSFTVQLETVEAALRELPRVADAVVVACEDDPASLAAYVVPAERRDDPEAIRRLAAAALPAHMAPAAVAAVPAIPRRDGVPDVAALRSTGTFAKPGTQRHPHLVAALAAVWGVVMGIDEVQPTDDFFELGGHSMLAARLAQQIGDALGVEVPLLAVFEHCTVEELAAELDRRNPDLEVALAQIEALSDDAFAELIREHGPLRTATVPATEFPLSAAQLQIWISEQLAAGAARDFVAALLYRIRGPLDVDALERALADIVARHEPLRASIVLAGEVPMQRVAEDVEIAIPVDDLAALADDEREDAVAQLARKEAERPFDLARGPLIRARLLRLAPEEHALVLVQHHLVTDAVSMEVFTRELAALYSGHLHGRAPRLPALAVTYSRYVEWERGWLAGEEAARMRRFWLARLADARPLELRQGRTGTPRSGLATRTCTRVLPTDVARGLADLARASRVTTFMVVSAAYAAVLADWSGQDDFVIGTTVDNRSLPRLSDTIGCFVNVVPLRVDCSGGPRFDELTRRIRTTVAEAYTHQALPFRELVSALGVRVGVEQTPLFQVTSEWVDQRQVALDLEGCDIDYEHIGLGTLRFELALYGVYRAGDLVLELEYAAGLWDPGVIDARLGQVAALLALAVRRGADSAVAELVRSALAAPANVVVPRAV